MKYHNCISPNCIPVKHCSNGKNLMNIIHLDFYRGGFIKKIQKRPNVPMKVPMRQFYLPSGLLQSLKVLMIHVMNVVYRNNKPYSYYLSHFIWLIYNTLEYDFLSKKYVEEVITWMHMHVVAVVHWLSLRNVWSRDFKLLEYEILIHRQSLWIYTFGAFEQLQL